MQQMVMKQRSAVPARVQPSRTARRVVAVRAQKTEQSGFAKLSNAIGMPTADGYFGFTPFAEQWVGRWAMLGFISSIVVEGVTGKGTLAQLGLQNAGEPSTAMLTALLVLSGGATAVGAVATVQKIATRKMSRAQMERYRSFLGLTKQDDWMVDNTAKSMQRSKGFTNPGFDMDAIDKVRTDGMAADRFLALDDKENGEQAAREMKAGASTAVAESAAPMAASTSAPARPQMTEADLYGINDDTYARGVELSNGRWAMIGFLAAILVEAGTGNGIIMQVVNYLKWSGLLGPMSGF